MAAKLSLLIFIVNFLSLALGNSISSRLFGSSNAVIGDFPWMVTLRLSSTSHHLCGGAIVTQYHVVTATHCILGFEPDDIYVVSGSVSLMTGGLVSRVTSIRSHPEYNLPNLSNDIGVLKLATAIPFSAVQQPIPLASSNTETTDCLISGWGRMMMPAVSAPIILQKHVLTSLSHEECLGIYGSTLIFNTSLCTLAPFGHGVCSGDSGGPLVCNGELAGVVSWGASCALGYPDVFARVYTYLDWLAPLIADQYPDGTFEEKRLDTLL